MYVFMKIIGNKKLTDLQFSRQRAQRNFLYTQQRTSKNSRYITFGEPYFMKTFFSTLNIACALMVIFFTLPGKLKATLIFNCALFWSLYIITINLRLVLFCVLLLLEISVQIYFVYLKIFVRKSYLRLNFENFY